MAKKKTMATARKKTKKTGRFLEFFRAISGFWPVWLSTLVIVGGVFGYQFYINNYLPSEQKILEKTNTDIVISVQQIRVIGELKYIVPLEIKKLVSESINSGLISNDLNNIKTFIESEAWVKSATIKRLPADILQLYVEEQKPMLRWKNKGLISVNGEMFIPKDIAQFNQLASIDSTEEAISEGLNILTKSILVLKSLDLNLAKIKQDRLGAWELETSQGVIFKFGRKELQHRLQVLEKLWPSAVKKGALKIVDLRYPNGAAVSYL